MLFRSWWPLQIATLALAYLLAQRQSSLRRSMLVAWAFGFGWSVCGVYWLYISMHRFGGLPSVVAGLAVALLALLLGVFPALAIAAGIRLRQRMSAPDPIAALLIFPALWALAEWLRGWIFTGLPWASSGYAHTASPLAGYAPIIGRSEERRVGKECRL